MLEAEAAADMKKKEFGQFLDELEQRLSKSETPYFSNNLEPSRELDIPLLDEI